MRDFAGKISLCDRGEHKAWVLLTPDARDTFLAEWTRAILNVIFYNDEVGSLDQLLVTFRAVRAVGGMAYHISDIYELYSLTQCY